MPSPANLIHSFSRSILLKLTSNRARGTLAVKPQTTSEGDMPFGLTRHHGNELRGISNTICSDFSVATGPRCPVLSNPRYDQYGPIHINRLYNTNRYGWEQKRL